MQPRTGASGVFRQGTRHGPSITYKITPCWVTLLQQARRAAVLDQPSCLRPPCSRPSILTCFCDSPLEDFRANYTSRCPVLSGKVGGQKEQLLGLRLWESIMKFRREPICVACTSHSAANVSPDMLFRMLFISSSPNIFSRKSPAAIVCTFQHLQYRQRLLNFWETNERKDFHNYVSVRLPTSLFCIERGLYSRTEIWERETGCKTTCMQAASSTRTNLLSLPPAPPPHTRLLWMW